MTLPTGIVLATYVAALALVVAAFPLARRSRRMLWLAWGAAGALLPLIATLAVLQVVPPAVLPWWRWYAQYALLLTLPTGAAVVIADQLVRRRDASRPALQLSAVVAAGIAALLVGTALFRVVSPEILVAVQ